MLCFNQLVRAGIHDCQLRLKARTPVTADATLASSPLARANLTPSYNLVPVQKLRETSRNTHALSSPICPASVLCALCNVGVVYYTLATIGIMSLKSQCTWQLVVTWEYSCPCLTHPKCPAQNSCHHGNSLVLG